MVKNLPVSAGDLGESVGEEDPLEKGIPTSAFLPGEFHRQRSIGGCCTWGLKELDMIE